MVDILPINPEATLEAVRRQLAQLHRRHVALMLPEGWTELDNPARMRILQRQAQFQRCHLGVITRNIATQQAAQAVGIPVFATPAEAEREDWRMRPLLPLIHARRVDAALPEAPRWQRPKIVAHESLPRLYRARQQRIRSEAAYLRPLPAWLRLLGNLLAGLLIAAALGFFVLYVIPAATITIVPGREPIAVKVQLSANPNLDVPDLEFNQLPARIVETNVEETGTLATTGTRQKATDKARGSVVFSNSSAISVRVPAGTTVSTGTGTAVNFRTTNAVEVPGGFNQRAEVSIEAIEPGIEGNVRANTITEVGSGYQLRLSVSNPAATYGGGSQLARVVTQADRDNLLEELLERAQARAPESLQSAVVAGEWLSPESVQTFITAQAFSAFNDEEAEELELTLRLLVRGVAVDQAVLREALLNSAQNTIPERGKLVASSLVVQREPGVVFTQGTVQFTMTVGAQYVIPIDPVEVRTAIAGLTPAAAVALVQQRWPVERPPEIYRDPEWFATLPKIGNRIQVRLEYDPVVAAQ
ncbi:MAG: baseplate J/gp47 family protein [Caldilineaceae bacterium]